MICLWLKKILITIDDDVQELSAFLTERQECLSDRSVEMFIGYQSVNEQEILCGSIVVGEDGVGKVQSVCPKVTLDGGVDADDRRSSPIGEINQILREELGGANITSSLQRAAWPFYTKRRGSVLSEQDRPPCKAVMFEVATGRGTVGGGEMLRGNATNASEAVPDSFVTSVDSSTLEGIVRRQADESSMRAYRDEAAEGMLRIPPVDEFFG